MSDPGTPNFYHPIQYGYNKRRMEMMRMAKEYSESTGPDHIADTSKKVESTCYIAALLAQADMLERLNAEKILDSMDADARNLRLAAAELWLRRRGKHTINGIWYLNEDAPERLNALPANIFCELEGGIRFGGCITTVRYKDDESAWAAAISAVAKCLAEGTIKDE